MIFCCNDVSPEEAESFARYKIHQEEDRFEERGFTLQSENYHAEEADMSWLDERYRIRLERETMNGSCECTEAVVRKQAPYE